MMTEEIIINGVNVAGCKYYTQDYQRANNIEGRYEHCKDVCELNGDNYFYCKMNNDCYYKQLKRLEQENKELKEKIKKYSAINEQDTKDYVELKRENVRLFNESIELRAKNIEYKSALEEIREKAQHCIRQDVCALCDYSKECAVPDADGLVYDNNKLLIKLINEVLQ
jgi:hypothetical protein